jgi:hypothetical protein
LFFPPSTPERRDDRDARDCLEFALRVREPHGIWGGLTEAERRVLLPNDDL